MKMSARAVEIDKSNAKFMEELSYESTRIS